ncbi:MULTISPECIES: hypothetical protein [Vibrio]|uniref:Uncharacterized protein n=2 Tax=Vibrio harveyi group TaxID=717610 RepID=A0AAP9GIY6_9VIBR|nr:MULTISPECIES: hypothetical protein [Vibrio]EGQ8056970.1 hypothetical protein [Vibrio alginolyticus]EGQ8535778.1 hypothetical protein [Vibrio parahaemolyticus]EGQ8927059.1 hypothetical protein [Vibrio parahaemolyticus]EGR2860596.1 hypothetical protein [Vibrio parahaemolyticus]EGR2948429.1 hypothetical protein [Vibrio parahaemolyticus]
MSDDKKIEFSQSDVLNALLHQRGFEGNREQHYATQESVDNVKERLTRFEAHTEKQLDSIRDAIRAQSRKFDRLQWLIVSLSVTLFFKEQILSLFM